MDLERKIPREALTVLLASALGEEKSAEVVSAAARHLGLTLPLYSADEVRAIFERAGRLEGLVGVVARFATLRGDVERLVAAPSSHAREMADEVPASVRGQAAVTFAGPAHDLLSLLAPSLGAEKARAATDAAARKLRIDLSRLTRADGLAVLEELATSDGIVGVVARFAKARFLLTPDR